MHVCVRLPYKGLDSPTSKVQFFDGVSNFVKDDSSVLTVDCKYVEPSQLRSKI